MKKSTVVIISSLCTLVVCLGMFCLYLILNNGVKQENTPTQKQEEITFKYEKTAAFYITPEHTKEIDERTLQSALSELLENGTFLYRINKEHPNTNYDITLHRINETDIYEISFKSDAEELSAEICDFIVDGFCEILEKVVGYDCKILDYAT